MASVCSKAELFLSFLSFEDKCRLTTSETQTDGIDLKAFYIKFYGLLIVVVSLLLSCFRPHHIALVYIIVKRKKFVVEPGMAREK